MPRIALVDEPADAGHHIAALGVSMGKIHHALPMTARGPGGETVRIKHPRGIVEFLADVDEAARPPVRSVGAIRTARRHGGCSVPGGRAPVTTVALDTSLGRSPPSVP